jgi:putative peptide zinc metalloprotease protein
VELLGEMKGSGYHRPPALARRPDGQVVQLTPLLHTVLQAVDGRRDTAEVARVASAAAGRSMTTANVETLLEKLRPMGLVVRADGEEPVGHRTNPLLALRMKIAVTDPERTRALTAPFARLFHPVVVVAVLAAFAWICWWVLVQRGLAAATHQAFARPGLLLAVLALTVLSGGFHEFGHAAAARRGGATPGVMGAGFYLIWPAFYTDVTDSYRLGRIGRLRTDLGGLYFNAIIVVATAVAWWVTGYDAVLLLVATQLLQMLRQLLPVVRFDGYHVLADLTGVPDLFHRIGPTLKSLVPGRAPDPRATDLRPWARAVVTTWVLIVVPFFAFTLVMMLLKVPRVVGTALVNADLQRQEMSVAAHQGDLIAMTARGLAMVVLALPILAFGVLFVRLGRSAVTGAWRRTTGKPVRRAGVAVLACALVAGLVLAWWPQPGRYRPIESWEGGTLTQLVPGVTRPAPGLAVGSTGRSVAYFPTGQVPTRDHPVLAAVLVPHDSGGAKLQPGTTSGAPGTSTGSPNTWIFPFDQPPAPGPGDTQALAVNTQNNTATYDTAFALVWADGDQPVTNTNEAYAVASCKNCAAVAVSFQVVMVVGQADIAVPQNLSVAVNYDCTSCLTYSLAIQLFVTLDHRLDVHQTTQLDQLWLQIMKYGAHLNEVPLSEIQGTLSQFEAQILTIVGVDPTALATQTATPSSSPTGTTTPTPTPSNGATVAPSPATPTTAASSTTTSDGSPSSSSSPSPTPSPSGSPSPTAPSASATANPPSSPPASPTPAPTSAPSP